VSALAIAAFLLVYGTALGLGAAASTGEAGLAGETVRAVVHHVPEVLALLALAAALLGLAPGWVGAAWGVLAYSAFMAVFGPFLGVPGPLVNLSLMSHVPQTPLGSAAPVAMAVLLALAAALTALALYGMRRRDLA
jgi:ABC-2 type transport system permease protein